MSKLLSTKYTNLLEIVESDGKIPMATIDNGDYTNLIDELETEGYNAYQDASTNYLIIERDIELLLKKQFVTLDELEEIEETEGITTEDNGLSGQYNGRHWYTANYNDKEYDLYTD